MRRPGRLGRKGQSATEYLILLTMVVFMAQLVGHFLIKYGHQILEQMLERLMDAALQLALG